MSENENPPDGTRPAAATDGAPDEESVVEVRPRRRIALFVAIPVAMLLLLLIILLATGNSASDRQSKSPLVGKLAPAIDGETLRNDNFSLDAYRGQWVVVNFFGSWCTPCIEEHPELLKFADAHRSAHDATIVSVAFADSPTAARQYFEKRGGDWPVLVEDTTGIAVSYGVVKVPETYVVAPTGIVGAKLIGGVTAAELDSIIKRLTGSSGSGTTK